MKPAEISEMARTAIDYMLSRTSADTLALLANRYPAATPGDISRACTYAVVICNDQGEFNMATAFQPIVKEARQREIAALTVPPSRETD